MTSRGMSLTHPGTSIRDSMEAMGWTVTECARGSSGLHARIYGDSPGICWSKARFWLRRRPHNDEADASLRPPAPRGVLPGAPEYHLARRRRAERPFSRHLGGLSLILALRGGEPLTRAPVATYASILL